MYASRTDRAKALFLDSVGVPLSRRVFRHLRQVVKAKATADPDMWKCVETTVKGTVDAIFDDVQLEVDNSMHVQLFKESVDVYAARLRTGLCCGAYLRIRRFALNRLLPHNRSIFGTLKDPVWWLLVLPIFNPFYCIRVVAMLILLLYHVLPGRADEYQLIQFIVILKVTQFVAAGMGASVQAGLHYFICISVKADEHSVLECVEKDGTLAFNQILLGADYIGNFLLVRLAHWCLTKSVRHGVGFVMDQPQSRTNEDFQKGPGSLARCLCPGRGGRVGMLVCYDTLCFLLSFVMLLVLTVLTEQGGVSDRELGVRRKANFFWCRVLYSCLALPFLFLVTPLATMPFSLVTHARPTGYNEEGLCVAFKLNPKPEPTDGSDSDGTTSGTSGDSDTEDYMGGSMGRRWTLGW